MTRPSPMIQATPPYFSETHSRGAWLFGTALVDPHQVEVERVRGQRTRIG